MSISSSVPHSLHDQKPVLALALSVLLASLGTSIANVALPALTLDFATTFQAAQWVVLSYLLGVTVVIVSAGRFSDMIGHRTALLLGIAIFAVASLLSAAAVSVWMLVAARALQGIGAAVLMAVPLANVRDLVAKERVGSAMGLLGTMSAVGTALGPSLGGVLIAVAGWRSIFVVLGFLAALNGLLVVALLPVGGIRAKKTLQDFDLAGTALLAAALASYALAVTARSGQFDTVNIVLVLTSIAAASAFVIVESNVKTPLIRLVMLRDVHLSSGLAANTLVAMVMMATLVVGPFYLSRSLELSPAMVGAVMTFGPVISILFGVPSGRLVDRLGARLCMIAGLAMMACGSFALVLLPWQFGVAGYVFAVFILTPGYQLFQAANNTSVMMNVDSEQRGVFSGMLSLSRNLGLITGASVMGALFTFAASSGKLGGPEHPDYGFGLIMTFAVAGMVMLLTLAVMTRVTARVVR